MCGSLSRPVYLTSNNNVYTGQGVLHSVSLTGGADAATLTLKYGGSSGTVFLVLAAAAGAVVERTFGAGLGVADLHATFTGTGPSASFEV